MTARPALVAIDLGAESCRVSLLRWPENPDAPVVTMIRRFANSPWDQGHAGLRWNLEHICTEIEAGLRACDASAAEGIAGIGVTGWAVDYVRLDAAGKPLAPPFCYRDPRTNEAMAAVHAIVPAERLYAKTGVQIQPINTLYQLYADKLAGASAPWVNLPEYILHWLGAPRVAEYTNATHTALVDPDTRAWSDELFSTLGLDRAAAPEVVTPGTVLGPLRKDLRSLPAFAATQLLAPACHDTASAIAGIPGAASGDCAYISSGTWSLVGLVLDETHRTPEACALGLTNLGAAGGGVLFHRGLPGMWLLRQCLNTWEAERGWSLVELLAESRSLPPSRTLLDLDDPAFLPPGNMPARINEQRRRQGSMLLPEEPDAAPLYANLIFRSLAQRYATLLMELARVTGRKPTRICVVGGGSRNEFLNALTAAATRLPVERCAVESSTLGNFAVQMARLDQSSDGVSPAAIAAHAKTLAEAERNNS
ncbi:MAG TPA: FGGY-family carbohydrate kinase [Acidobacteriaceae bacterium]|nr:FGGY-family carbohydrate kinase [Acidobacteriaceae bacterium]